MSLARSLSCGVLLALFSATTALAQDCPTAADLETGITLRTAGPDVAEETFTRLGPDKVLAVYHESGAGARVQLLRGVYITELVDLFEGEPDPESRTSYAFLGAPPEPQADLVYTAKVLRRDPGKGLLQVEQETQEYTFGSPIDVVFGVCRYEAIPIITRYPDSGHSDVDTLHYLPALGLSYLYAFEAANSPRETYPYAEIFVTP